VDRMHPQVRDDFNNDYCAVQKTGNVVLFSFVHLVTTFSGKYSNSLSDPARTS
jgi:hypothetical protein